MALDDGECGYGGALKAGGRREFAPVEEDPARNAGVIQIEYARDIAFLNVEAMRVWIQLRH
ncbi:hypothetical protein D9M70_606930 [compost metagenome]